MLARLLRLHPSTYRRLVRLSKEAERDGAYRVAKRLQAVVLNSEGQTSGELARILKAPRSKVSEWLQRYQSDGVDGLLEGYRSGRPSELTQQQQQQLQQIQTENQQANPAPDPSAEPPASAVNQLNACINNLRQIDAAKQQWALENDKTADAIPPALELLPFLRDGIFPMCPSGGAYTINAVGVPPTCSIPGHVLP